MKSKLKRFMKKQWGIDAEHLEIEWLNDVDSDRLYQWRFLFGDRKYVVTYNKLTKTVSGRDFAARNQYGSRCFYL